MTYTLPTLPTNIDTTYPDRSPGDKVHQQHHDAIGTALATINARGGVATGDDLAGLGGGGGGGGAVSSVNSQTGAVVLGASDVGAATTADIADMVTSTDVTTIVRITQATYDGLGSRDAETLYVIVG